jgi:hypothetical protein
MKRRTSASVIVLAVAFLTAGCERLGIPDPAKAAAERDAEGKAIGAACRHAGRSLEDCYALNERALKAAVFSGWREMNDYMVSNKMETVPSNLAQAAGAAQDVAPAPAEAATTEETKPAPEQPKKH